MLVQNHVRKKLMDYRTYSGLVLQYLNYAYLDIVLVVFSFLHVYLALNKYFFPNACSLHLKLIALLKYGLSNGQPLLSQLIAN